MGPGTVHDLKVQVSEGKTLEDQITNNLEVHPEPDSDSGRLVQGMNQNIFFLAHDVVAENHINEFEADMCDQLRKHLTRQGYESQQILILTTTDAQATFLQQQDLYTQVDKIDFAGGKDAQIVILSLVERIPEDLLDEEDNLDLAFQIFAKIIKYALEHSTTGLYILGHNSLLTVSSSCGQSQWSKLLEEFSKLEAIGPSLTLASGQGRSDVVLSSQNWENPRELGLCLEIRDCGHLCPRKRHPYDPSHEHPDVICDNECQRLCPNGGHKCKEFCYEACQPCQIIVSRKMPCCGHTFVGPCEEMNKNNEVSSNAKCPD